MEIIYFANNSYIWIEINQESWMWHDVSSAKFVEAKEKHLKEILASLKVFHQYRRTSSIRTTN